jgi:multiple antibiotic resistance protein
MLVTWNDPNRNAAAESRRPGIISCLPVSPARLRWPSMDWKFVANCLVTVLAILDPFGALAMFLALLGDATHDQRRRGARLAALTVLSTLIVAMLFGRQLLTLLGISMGAFRVAGGAIILLTGLKMLGGQLGPERRASETLTKVSLQPELQAIVPLGTPLIAGAGSISTVILFEHTAPDALHVGAVAAAVALCSVLLFAVLRAADSVAGALGHVGMSIAVRLMGLILVAMGVQFMANGLLDLFPLLARSG